MLIGISGSKQVLRPRPDLLLEAWPSAGTARASPRLLAEGVGVPGLDPEQVAAVGGHGVGAAERLGDPDPRPRGEEGGRSLRDLDGPALAADEGVFGDRG